MIFEGLIFTALSLTIYFITPKFFNNPVISTVCFSKNLTNFLSGYKY